MMPGIRILKLLRLLAPLLVVVVAGVWLTMQVLGAGTSSKRADAPGSPCWELLYAPLPPGKSEQLQQWCDTIRAASDSLPPKGPAPSLPPLSPVATSPPCDQRSPSSEVSGCAWYGILDDDREPPAGYKDTYLTSNVWAGQRIMVFAGALKDDPNQGVIVVTDRDISGAVSFPRLLGEYRTPSAQGALRITDVQGNVLNFVTPSGVHYTFNVDTFAFVGN